MTAKKQITILIVGLLLSGITLFGLANQPSVEDSLTESQKASIKIDCAENPDALRCR